MVSVGIVDGGVDAEAGFCQHAVGVVVVVFFKEALTLPFFFAFDAEVVIGELSQLAKSRLGFEQALSQLDACWDAGAVHFANGEVFVFFDVSLFWGFVLGYGLVCSNAPAQ